MTHCNTLQHTVTYCNTLYYKSRIIAAINLNLDNSIDLLRRPLVKLLNTKWEALREGGNGGGAVSGDEKSAEMCSAGLLYFLVVDVVP